MSDLDFQNLSTVQSKAQLTPNTIASTTTIAPTSFITFVSGTTDIATITPPVSGQVGLVLVFTHTTPPTLLTTGNVLVATTTFATNRPVWIFYDPNQAKWLASVP